MSECGEVRMTCGEQEDMELRLVVLLDKCGNSKKGRKDKVHTCACPCITPCPTDSSQPRRVVVGPVYTHHQRKCSKEKRRTCTEQRREVQIQVCQPPVQATQCPSTPQLYQYQSPMVYSGDPRQYPLPTIHESLMGPSLRFLPPEQQSQSKVCAKASQTTQAIQKAPSQMPASVKASCRMKPTARESEMAKSAPPPPSPLTAGRRYHKCKQVPQKLESRMPASTTKQAEVVRITSVQPSEEVLASAKESEMSSRMVQTNKERFDSTKSTLVEPSVKPSEIPVSTPQSSRMAPSEVPVSTQSSRMAPSEVPVSTQSSRMAPSEVPVSTQSSRMAPSEVPASSKPSGAPPPVEESESLIASAKSSRLAPIAEDSELLASTKSSRMAPSAKESEKSTRVAPSVKESEIPATTKSSRMAPSVKESEKPPSTKDSEMAAVSDKESAIETQLATAKPSAGMSRPLRSTRSAESGIPKSTKSRMAESRTGSEIPASPKSSRSDTAPSPRESGIPLTAKTSKTGTSVKEPEIPASTKSSRSRAADSLKETDSTKSSRLAPSVKESEISASRRSSRSQVPDSEAHTFAKSHQSLLAPHTHSGVKSSARELEIPTSVKPSRDNSATKMKSERHVSTKESEPDASSKAASEKESEMPASAKSSRSRTAESAKESETALSTKSSRMPPSGEDGVLASTKSSRMEPSAKNLELPLSAKSSAQSANESEKPSSAKASETALSATKSQSAPSQKNSQNSLSGNNSKSSVKASASATSSRAASSTRSQPLDVEDVKAQSELIVSAIESRLAEMSEREEATVEGGDGCTFGSWTSWETWDKIIALLNGEPMCAPNLCEGNCEEEEKKEDCGDDAENEVWNRTAAWVMGDTETHTARSGNQLLMIEPMGPDTVAVMIALPILFMGLLSAFNTKCR